MSRPLTSTEKNYLTMEQLGGKMNILRCIIGRFNDIDPFKIEDKFNFKQQSEVNRPNSNPYFAKVVEDCINRLYLSVENHPNFKLILNKKKWIPNPNWNKQWVENHLIQRVNDEINPSHTVEFNNLDVTVQGIKLWIYNNGFIFQASHAITDGMGIQNLIKDFFNNQLQSTTQTYFSFYTERQFAKKFIDKFKFNIPKSDQFFELNFPKNNNPNNKNHMEQLPKLPIEWHCFKIPKSKFNDQPTLGTVVSKLFYWIKSNHPQNGTRIMIPVNLRQYETAFNYDGNLSLPIWLEIGQKCTALGVAKKIQNGIAQKYPLMLSTSPWLEKPWTHFFQEKILHYSFKRCHELNQFPASAIISHLGNQDPIDYSLDYFACTDVWSIALHSGFAPIQLHIIKFNNHANIHLSYNTNYFNKGQINQLVESFYQSSNE
jgi:hypothetical protein